LIVADKSGRGAPIDQMTKSEWRMTIRRAPSECGGCYQLQWTVHDRQNIATD
jgi:hypothetical protein